ncbi:cobalamin biosynthesis protein, partial [Methylogaea oryzae]|uniref:cobalamin biosynthesis protein n=1 Tax=Methylogaea oryzae TaxID=1295382 RepID=UPI0020D091C8
HRSAQAPGAGHRLPPRRVGGSHRAAVRQALGDASLDLVREVATVSVKANEPGLLAFCERYQLPLRVIALQQISDRPG